MWGKEEEAGRDMCLWGTRQCYKQTGWHRGTTDARSQHSPLRQLQGPRFHLEHFGKAGEKEELQQQGRGEAQCLSHLAVRVPTHSQGFNASLLNPQTRKACAEHPCQRGISPSSAANHRLFCLFKINTLPVMPTDYSKS